jgi:hypothetical protein
VGVPMSNLQVWRQQKCHHEFNDTAFDAWQEAAQHAFLSSIQSSGCRWLLKSAL